MSKRRKRYARRTATPKTAPFWQSFLGLPGGAAMITAMLGILGIIVTAYVNTYISAATQKNSTAGQQIAVRETVTEPYGQYLEAQRKFVFDAAGLIGRCVSASDGLIALTDPSFDPSRYKGIESQRLEMRKKFNDCAVQWNEEYNQLTLGMSYYHSGQPAVAGAWDGLQRATTEIMDCAQQWYVNHNTEFVATAGVCKAEKDDLNRQFKDFKREIGAASRYAWQQREAAGSAVEAAPGKKPGQIGLVEQ